MKKKALITGITGQDGSYLAELLLDKGYEVYGINRRSSSFNTRRIDHIFDKIKLFYGDLLDGTSLSEIVKKVHPDEVYHLGAQSHVKVSFEVPEYTCNTDALGTLRLLEAVRTYAPEAKLYNAASSEMYGSTPPPQDENTPFDPQSPYACAKVFSYNLVRNYRKAYGLFLTNGILFNHESPKRGETFVTRKITKAAARIRYGLQERLSLGNMEARRDWGHAKDYVNGMWLMLQHDEPDDFVLSMNESHSVKDFAEEAFSFVDLDYRDYVDIDPRYFRPSEVDALHGDSSKARDVLGWSPDYSFTQLVVDMMTHDLIDAWDEKELRKIQTRKDKMRSKYARPNRHSK